MPIVDVRTQEFITSNALTFLCHSVYSYDIVRSEIYKGWFANCRVKTLSLNEAKLAAVLVTAWGHQMVTRDIII